MEKEGYTIPSHISASLEQRVLVSYPLSNGEVIKIQEVAIVTMNDDGCGLDFSGVEVSRGLAADGQCEAEHKETDAGHEGEDDAEEADLLSPSPPLFRCLDARSSEQRLPFCSRLAKLSFSMKDLLSSSSLPAD